MPDKRQVGLRLEESLIQRVTELAKASRRTFTAQLTILVEEALARREQTNGWQEQAIAQAVKP